MPARAEPRREARTETGGPNGNVSPVLWQLKVSHYNEKARWALDYKRVAHLRRSLTPGRHRGTAVELSGGRTFPVLVLDGEAIGDSTRIIAALERRYPAPALYPRDAAARRRALELEEFFDEKLGPHTRLLALHYMLPDPSLMLSAFAPDLAGVRRLAARATFPLLRNRIAADFAINEASVAHAHDQLRIAGERFRAELQPSGYLVDENFTVADLTLASLVAPLAAPEQFPYPQPQRGHPRLEPVRDALADQGLLDWTLETYARHRGQTAEI